VHISVIIPAHNAVETITDTLDSLLAQTFPGWEAIVVDDGSSDDTAARAARFAERDARIRLVQQSQRGVSAARNTGMSLARYDWLLFLDADDWLAPVHLARLTDLLLSTPDLDAACCNYTRIAPDGTRFDNEFRVQSGDLFAVFARACIMAIHACIMRRSLVEAVGGFDPALRTCEDWDLWQRIARTGARFGVLHEVYAFYRMRPASASVDGHQFLADSLRVLALGHAPDPRVSNPHPAHASGQPAEQLSGLKFYPLCWAAGLMLGHGEDARALLDVLKEHRDPGLAPYGVAEAIFRAALLPTCRTPAAWVDLWPSVEGPLVAFLAALEAQSTAPGLAPRTRTILERLILEHATALRPCTVGATHAVQVEVSEPIPDIRPPARTERLQCTITLAGTRLGTLTLPVCDGLVSHLVLADAIAADLPLKKALEFPILPNISTSCMDLVRPRCGH